MKIKTLLSALLIAALLLSPAALMEEMPEEQEAVVEEAATTIWQEDQAEHGTGVSLSDEDVEADTEIIPEPVDAVVEESEDVDLLRLHVFEVQSDDDEPDLDTLERISTEANVAPAMLMEAASLNDDSAFPDAAFREYLKDFDTDKDGALSDEERSVVEYIFVDNKNITDLTGIKLFPNLGVLYCMHNKLTNLDVSGLLNLFDLKCGDNQLTKIDVSNCTNLHGLSCESNRLTNLDVSGLINLVGLRCYHNQLTTLDFSDHPNLAKIANSEFIQPSDWINDPTVIRYISLYYGSLDVDPGVQIVVNSVVQIITSKPADKTSDSTSSASDSSSATTTVVSDLTADSTPATPSEPITIANVPASTKAKAKKNKVTVTWKKIKKNKKTKALLNQITGIEVQYSTDPNFATDVNTKSVSKKKTKVTLKLQKKTQYYIRVRYVGMDGVSNWSATKKVKTKK